ncbi:hypothetical protein K438DRAFT_415505 [Mycena galopus ATCC 62051]|nr:hypothetical protein K438DRAFT_415505 [Mycena galopus ATCC 62051]
MPRLPPCCCTSAIPAAALSLMRDLLGSRSARRALTSPCSRDGHVLRPSSTRRPFTCKQSTTPKRLCVYPSSRKRTARCRSSTDTREGTPLLSSLPPHTIPPCAAPHSMSTIDAASG